MRLPFGFTPAVALATLAAPLAAQPDVGDDPTSTGAAIDGALTPGEYTAKTAGIGAGFGSMIGAGTTLWADTASDGTLSFLLDATGGNCSLGADDTIVLYVDSRPGGFGTTAGFTDVGDPGRAAASGKTGGAQADLTFAPGFSADFAIVIRGDSGSLFELVANAPHNFVATVARAPMAFSSSCTKEWGGVTMAQLGSAPGGAFDFVATLLNASNAYRSNEFHGVAAAMGMADPSGNIGPNAFSLAAGDWSTFQSFAPVASIVRHKRAWGFDGWAGAGLRPSALAAPGQLVSDNWAVTGLSDGPLAFGGDVTTGDFARGVATMPVSTGGLFSFAISSNPSLGYQATDADFTPGTITVRLANEVGSALYGVRVSYELRVRNDQDRASSIDLSVSNDGATFSTLATHTTVQMGAGTAWTLVPVQAETTTLPIPPGGFVYVRFSSDDAGGSGSRDEISLDDLVVTPLVDLCPPDIDDGNPCTIDQCDPATGTVTHPNAPLGTSCDDADACTTIDSCDSLGNCDGNPVACVPPPAECIDAVTSRTYSGGACDPSDGMCDFVVTDTVCSNMCDVASGFCDDDPCATVTCDMPPPPECIGDESVVYQGPGQCMPGTGICDYPSTSETCDAGCNAATGLCNDRDPCFGVACDTPPSQCHEPTGACAGGACTYAPRPSGSPCDDGNASTADDTCDGLGSCSGAPAGQTTSAGTTGSGGGEGGADGGGADDGGCSCSAPPSRAAPAGFLAALALLALLRDSTPRNRCSPSATRGPRLRRSEPGRTRRA